MTVKEKSDNSTVNRMKQKRCNKSQTQYAGKAKLKLNTQSELPGVFHQCQRDTRHDRILRVSARHHLILEDIHGTINL